MFRRKLLSDVFTILKEQSSFFENLLFSEGIDETEANGLQKTVNKQLNEDEKTFCYKDVTEDDIKNVLKIQKCNKSPGEDGIVNEFYQAFWNLIRRVNSNYSVQF